MRQNSLLIIFLIVFVELVGFGILLPILPFYAQLYGATAVQLGWLFSTYTLVQFLVSPIWGRFSDYVGRRTVLFLCLLGTCVSMLLMGVAGSLKWLFIARIIAGASGATLSTAYAYVTDIATAEDRPRALGMLGAGFGLGLIFGPAIGGLLSRYGYALPMFVIAGLSFFNFVFAILKLDEPRIGAEMRSANRYKRFDLSTIRLALDDPRTRLAALLLFLVTFAMAQMESMFAIYMKNRFSYDAETVGMLLAIMGLVIVGVQSGLVTLASKKLGPIRTIIGGSLIFGLGMLGFVSTSWAITMVAFLLILAFGQGSLNPVLNSLAYAGTAAHKRGTAMGVYRSFGSLARIIAPPSAGWLFDHLSWRSPFYTGASFLGGTALLALLWVVLPSKVSEMKDAESNPYLEG